jgi:glycerate kinase
MAAVRIVIAPDKFAGTLTAVEAAEAIATGWGQHAPDDELIRLPMADGGPGFVDTLASALGGDLLSVTVSGPNGVPVPGAVLVSAAADGRRTAYIESSHACGLHLVAAADRDPGTATSFGVGELVAAAVDAGVDRIVVGLGGSGTNDGGAGMLLALGARSVPGDALLGGPLGLEALSSVDLAGPTARLAGVEVLAASDVDNPLLGLRGATNVFGPQKGVATADLPRYDAALQKLAELSGAGKLTQAGAGAAGGIGWALMALGASRVPGIGTVAEALGLADAVAKADLVISGEGSFDSQSAGGKVVVGVARIAEGALRPCVVIAGRVEVGNREMRAMGISSAYSMTDVVGREASFARPADALARTAARVARTWSHGSSPA